ncbi:MAG TPA: hypothetical protein VFE33_10175 [Thermoanaerobaculia bacterium]|nr:hypothetical protein [Thermoanaerobaculia bacterium]
MSVLSFPRLYFQGFMQWDPCTFNNNDWQEFPTYDAANAALNWPFLATQGAEVPPGITPENFVTTFRPWAIALQPDAVDSPAGARVPAEWNMFGSHGVSFVQYNNYTTTITSGALGYGRLVTADPLIGGPVGINGDGGSGPGRLVDINPASFWSSQVYFGQLSFGSGNCILQGTPSARMHSRWVNPARIYTQDQELTQPAASFACCFQAGIPYDQIVWPSANANSPLAVALQQAASQPSALGISVRFTAYVNLYFKNGVFNDISAQPSSYEELAECLATAWAAWNENGDPSQFFSQPCYSHVVGVVGVWNQGELATAPVGRYLSAANAVTPAGVSGAAALATEHRRPVRSYQAVPATPAAIAGNVPLSTPLGPLVANVDFEAELISLDLNSTMPENGTPGEWPSDLTKTDFGPLGLGIVNSEGNFTAIATIEYAQYQQTAYEASAGIVDIPFPNSGTGELLQNGALAIQVQGQTALLEQLYSAQTDQRGIYLDQGGQADFDVSVYQVGTPAPGTNVLIAKYNSGGLSLIPTNQSQLVNFTNGSQTEITVGGITTAVTIVTADASGIASVGIAAQSPGFPVLAFFPYTGATLPQPPVTLLGGPWPLVTYAFYTTVRVLPFDDAAPAELVALWNTTGSQEGVWQFVYHNILYIYDMIFSVMLKYVNLGSQSAVEENFASIWSAISAESAEASTYAMPITRDMSAGKRLALQLWIYLVANNYDVPDFNVNSIPAGWSPS